MKIEDHMTQETAQIIHYGYVPTAHGFIEIKCDHEAIIYIGFTDDIFHLESNTLLIAQTKEQLKEYISGIRKTFSLPIKTVGTVFQKRVWQALTTIPFGETRSYQEIGELIDSPKAVRAIGAANGKNPISIIVPCHRVIGKGGQLTGYSGGLLRKKWLLEIENN